VQPEQLQKHQEGRARRRKAIDSNFRRLGFFFDAYDAGNSGNSNAEFSDERIGSDRLAVYELFSVATCRGGGHFVCLGRDTASDVGDSECGNSFWGGRGNLSGGVRPEKQMDCFCGDQHRQSRRGAVDSLWTNGLGAFCLSVSFWAKFIVGGVGLGVSGVTDRDRCDAGITPNNSLGHTGGGVCLGGHALAGGMASSSAVFDGGDCNGCDLSDVTGDWGKCAVDYDRSIDLYCVSSSCSLDFPRPLCFGGLAFFSLHGIADSDV